jgi:hypothetical protein
MNDATSADDRLPWLETPRAARKDRARAAARRAGPLLLLLGLLLAGTVAVMAFLAGRGSGPFAPQPRATDAPPAAVAPQPIPSAPQPAPVPAPVPEAPAAPAAPIITAPAPAAAAPTATKPRAKDKRETSPRGPAVSPPVVRVDAIAPPAPTQPPASTLPPAPALPPPYQWPVPSAAGPSGRVIQLGYYYTGRETMAAWRRLRRSYPYLATMPRKVTVVSPGPGRPRFYQLRIGAPSAAHARAICDYLHRIGRGCIVV